MPYSMSTPRKRSIARDVTKPQPVKVWGYDADGGDDGLPVVVARGLVAMSYDGPLSCRIKGPDGSFYTTTESAWSLLAHEWTIEAARSGPKG